MRKLPSLAVRRVESLSSPGALLSREDSEINAQSANATAWTHARRRSRRYLNGLWLHGPAWMVEAATFDAAFLLAFVFRYGGHVPAQYSHRHATIAAALVTSTYLGASVVFRGYRSVWRFVTVRDMVTVALTVVSAVAAIAVAEMGPFAADRPIPLSALFIGGALSYLALAHLKLLHRVQVLVHSRRQGHPLIVVGAGAAGLRVVRQLHGEPGPYRPVAFVDDDPGKIGRRISGLPVVGGRRSLGRAVARYRAAAVAIAMPSAHGSAVSDVMTAATEAGARVLMVPPGAELLSSGARLPLRDLGLEDLFGRSEVDMDAAAIRDTFSGKRVLVTGAAGSIGSEVVRQLCHVDVEEVILVDNNESGMTELRDSLPRRIRCVVRIGDVSIAPAIRRILHESRPHIVVHAAALKHVDLLEAQPLEAVRVNVLGTWNCARASEEAGADLFVFVSTDKAVDPAGVLGTSKRCGEHLVASLADSPTRFMAVRFGNVLGSRGSVVPRFERQIADGGPLTVTDPHIERYFMSIIEAVRLVLQGAAMAEGGRIYVLDMGEAVPIVQVATRLANLRGLRVPDDIAIEFTGLRPGERLREKLVGVGERTSPTRHPKIREVISGQPAPVAAWEVALQSLAEESERESPESVRMRLQTLASRHLDHVRT